jgi:transient-receptor-potential-like protein
MSYFEESATLPPPFNIFPAPKHFMKLFGLRKTDKLRRMSSKRKEKNEKERDFRYTAVMRALIWRYVAAMQRKQDDNPVTEDDINEIKSEITASKCEILETLSRNGMKVDDDATKDKSKFNYLFNTSALTNFMLFQLFWAKR